MAFKQKRWRKTGPQNPERPARTGWGRRACVLLFLVGLAGCGELASPFGETFHPLNNEIAVQAAPQLPAAAGAPAGNNLYCRIGNGSARFPNGWNDFAEAGFTLNPGSRINVPLTKNAGSGSIMIQGIFDTNGQKLIFCPVVDGPPDKKVTCASLYALEDDLNAGIKRSFDIPDSIRGADISCAYKERDLQKL